MKKIWRIWIVVALTLFLALSVIAPSLPTEKDLPKLYDITNSKARYGWHVKKSTDGNVSVFVSKPEDKNSIVCIAFNSGTTATSKTVYDTTGKSFATAEKYVISGKTSFCFTTGKTNSQFKIGENSTEIIFISEAMHLDENKNWISDITNYVKFLDNNFSEQINNNHFVRVTFITTLDENNDITIFAYSTGDANVEIYKKDSNALITKIVGIKSFGRYSKQLTGMDGNTNSFDLKIVGNPIKIDNIIDPTATIEEPPSPPDEAWRYTGSTPEHVQLAVTFDNPDGCGYNDNSLYTFVETNPTVFYTDFDTCDGAGNLCWNFEDHISDFAETRTPYFMCRGVVVNGQDPCGSVASTCTTLRYIKFSNCVCPQTGNCDWNCSNDCSTMETNYTIPDFNAAGDVTLSGIGTRYIYENIIINGDLKIQIPSSGNTCSLQIKTTETMKIQ